MSSSYVVGIDTSNYTTSVSVADETGEIIANLKSPLPVEQGACGLRQSDAVFAHIKNLPSLMQEVRQILRGERPVAIGVSARPRNVEGSYMPCFLAGVAAAESAASTLGVPLYTFSHQCGHIRAAMYAAKKADLLGKTFGAFHISGGTTEMLLVSPAENGFSVSCVGGTKDLNAGQAVDRIGVYLGLSFPCGVELEKLAAAYIEKNGRGAIPKRKVKAEDGYVHLSGLENLAKKLYEDTEDKGLCAAFVLDYIASAVFAMGAALRQKYGSELPILFAGGVMSNMLIQEKIKKEMKEVFFATPAFSADNGAGIALLAREAHQRAKTV
ncbi:MAG: peptidase M22 [Clostridia bacterium]|nr:peptidase M22 [Clostridia bacterium]